jgi:RNA polymerase sigma-70 factor, ECF subfamily
MHGTTQLVVSRDIATGRVDWAREYDEHAREILAYLTRLTADRDVASELLQDTFVRGMHSESSIRDPKALRAWLYRTATNLAHNDRRRRALVRFLPFRGDEHAPRGAFDPESEQVQRALRAIAPDHAAALLLFYVHGFSRHEIAEMYGVGEEAVKSRLARGRRDFMASYRRMERGLAR